MLLVLQAVAGPPVPLELRKRIPGIATPCPVDTAGGDIVVCARPTDQRLKTLPEPVVAPPDDPLSFRLQGGGKGSVHAIHTELPGASGQGVAVTLKIPLSRGKRD